MPLVVWEEGSWEAVLVVAANHLQLRDNSRLERHRLPWEQIAELNDEYLLLFLALSHHCGVTRGNRIFIALLSPLLVLNLRLNRSIIDLCFELGEERCLLERESVRALERVYIAWILIGELDVRCGVRPSELAPDLCLGEGQQNLLVIEEGS